MQGTAGAKDPLDPEIRAFVAEMKAAFSQYPPLRHLSFRKRAPSPRPSVSGGGKAGR